MIKLGLEDLNLCIIYISIFSFLACLLGCFVFSPFLKLKMLGVACNRVLGIDSKIEKKIEMTSFRGAGRALSFFREDFPNSRTDEDSASILVLKCAELLISYTLLRDSVTLTLSKNKLFLKIKFCVILSYKLIIKVKNIAKFVFSK